MLRFVVAPKKGSPTDSGGGELATVSFWQPRSHKLSPTHFTGGDLAPRYLPLHSCVCATLKVAVVDAKSRVMVYDTLSKEVVFQESGATRYSSVFLLSCHVLL